MEYYQLKSDEVVLFKGFITFVNEQEKTNLILTNQNVVFITKYKDEFLNENAKVEYYSVEEVKMYEGKPQVKVNKNLVEIYFTTTEKEFVFDVKAEQHKFVDEAIKLLTGKTKVQRAAEKVKSAIDLVDDTFGIDSVHMVGNAIKDGVVGKVTKGLGSIGNVFKKKK